MSNEFISFALESSSDFIGKNFIILIFPLLVVMAWRLWVYLRYTLFIDGMKWDMLEIRLPQDVFKSPEAMELVLVNALYQTGGTGTWFHKYWRGNLRMWFTLEIVSMEGRVHFFIRTPKRFRDLIESQIYAQYPQAEITETEDYTDLVPPYDKKAGEWNLWGCNLVLTKPDPYPIKTYADYGLDKATLMKEEQKIDPITSMMEFMGSLRQNEHVWFQISVRADTERFDGKDGKKVAWKDAAKQEVETLKEKFKPKEEGKPAPEKTKLDQDIMNAIERSIQKIGFDCGITAMYIAKKDAFDANRIPALLSSIRQYNSPVLNGFKPTNTTDVTLPWQDLSGNVVSIKKSSLLEQYRNRGYFYPHFDPWRLSLYFKQAFSQATPPFILNAEELATIYHFPGRVAETPAFARVESKRAEPPANLPL